GVARPWRQLSQAVLHWSQGDWQARIASGGATGEFRRVADLLNVLAERVDEEQQQLHHLVERAEALSQEAARAKLQLVDSLDTIPEGFAIFDAEDRFLLCNGRFREIHAETPDLLRPGEPFERII